MAEADEFKREMHIKFLLRHLHVMPAEINDQKQSIKDFVHSCQILPKPGDEETSTYCGFRGSSFFGNKFNANCVTYGSFIFERLYILGDDFSKVNKKAVIRGLKELQQPDGSFSCVPGGSENDMRFVYCACAISHMLGDWGGIDQEKAHQFILSSQAYDGGIAQGPSQESHGGSTYCAVQALKLMGKLDTLPRKQALIQWCLERQQTGFQGRINKVPDTCYSFWIGGALHTLGAHGFTNFPAIKGHSLNCQQKIGGFSKWPETYPDILHTLCGLALGGEEGLAKLDCTVGCTERASGDWIHTK